MTYEFEPVAREYSAKSWLIPLTIGLILIIVSLFLMIDIASDDLLNFVILGMLFTGTVFLVAACIEFLRIRQRKKRLERIRSRRVSVAT